MNNTLIYQFFDSKQSKVMTEVQGQYAYQLAQYSKLKVQTKTCSSNKTQIENDIILLEEEIKKVAIQTQNSTNQSLQKDQSYIKNLAQEHQSLKNQLSQLQKKNNQLELQSQDHISQLKNSIENLKKKKNQQVSTAENPQEYEEKLKKIQDQKNILSSQNAKNQQEVIKLKESVQQIENEIETTKQNGQEPKIQDLSSYIKELQDLQNQLKNLEDQQISIQNTQVQGQKKKKDVEQLKEVLAKTINHSNEIKKSGKHLEEKILKQTMSLEELSLKNQELEKKIKELEQENLTLIKTSDQLLKDINDRKKTIEQAKKQEKNNNKKQKEVKRNFKHQIIQAEKQTELLKKDLQRENKRLQSTIDLKKTYASRESLQILQKQYQRHKNDKRPSLETETARRDRLLRDNKLLKQRVINLKKLSKQLQTNSENSLKEAKKKGDQIISQKLSLEKLLNQSTNRLNDYMKEYPHHQKQKQEKKLAEKKKQQEAKAALLANQQKKDASQGDGSKRKKKKNDVEDIEDNNTAYTNWYEGHNRSTEKQHSFLQNRNIRITIGLVVLLVIFFLLK